MAAHPDSSAYTSCDSRAQLIRQIFALCIVFALGLDQSPRTGRWRLLLMTEGEEMAWSGRKWATHISICHSTVADRKTRRHTQERRSPSPPTHRPPLRTRRQSHISAHHRPRRAEQPRRLGCIVAAEVSRAGTGHGGARGCAGALWASSPLGAVCAERDCA